MFIKGLLNSADLMNATGRRGVLIYEQLDCHPRPPVCPANPVILVSDKYRIPPVAVNQNVFGLRVREICCGMGNLGAGLVREGSESPGHLRACGAVNKWVNEGDVSL